jgi:hypothetical protein
MGAHFRGSDTGGTIDYSMVSDVEALNPVYSQWTYDWVILGECTELYGVALNPYTLEDMAWMVKEWTVATWDDAGTDKSVVIMEMYDNIEFHTGALATSTDIQFGYDVIRSMKDAWVNGWISGDYMHHTEIVDPLTVAIFMDEFSGWALHWVSALPLLPKFKWETYKGVAAGIAVGTGNGTQTEFWLPHEYEAGYPTIIGSETIYLDGTPTTAYTMADVPSAYGNGWTDYTKSGKVVFDTAPGAGVAITADYQYYDWHGFAPDPTLDGTGMWKFVSHVPGSTVTVTANRRYFMPVHPKGDVNYDHNIDLLDRVIVDAAHGSKRFDDPLTPWDDSANWNIIADIMAPWEEVDVLDFVKVATQSGQTWYPDTTWDTVP